MAQFGGYLILFGIGSLILNQLDMEFIILAWIDLWGPTVGWTIRIGMIVGGLALFLLGSVVVESGNENQPGRDGDDEEY